MANTKKPTKQQIEQGKLRAGGNNPIKVTNAGLKKLGKAAVEAAMIAAPGGAGRKIGQVAGKAIARKLAEEASPKILKAANAAKGSGKMVVKEAEKGNKMATAAKRDVVVKTDNKVIPVRDKSYINKTGEKSIKVNTNKPTVRVIEKEVTAAKAANRTKASNQLRYGGAKAEAFRGREAIKSSKILPKSGTKIGGTAGVVTGATAANTKKKKSK